RGHRGRASGSEPRPRQINQPALATKPERRQRVQTRMRFGVVPLGPTLACTVRRLGRWVLFVLMFEWLTVLATRRCLPQIAHCAGIPFPPEGGVPLPWTDENGKAGRGHGPGGRRRGRRPGG